MDSRPIHIPEGVWYGLLGLQGTFVIESWPLREGESIEDRATLLEFLKTPSAMSELLDFLRTEKVPRNMANRLLSLYNIPTTIPAGAMNALGLKKRRGKMILCRYVRHTKDGSPLDWPVFWDYSPYSGGWYWRRCDVPICAVQLKDGAWACESATY